MLQLSSLHVWHLSVRFTPNPPSVCHQMLKGSTYNTDLVPLHINWQNNTEISACARPFQVMHSCSTFNNKFAVDKIHIRQEFQTTSSLDHQWVSSSSARTHSLVVSSHRAVSNGVVEDEKATLMNGDRPEN